jgi:hypothetical protein
VGSPLAAGGGGEKGLGLDDDRPEAAPEQYTHSPTDGGIFCPQVGHVGARLDKGPRAYGDVNDPKSVGGAPGSRRATRSPSRRPLSITTKSWLDGPVTTSWACSRPRRTR